MNKLRQTAAGGGKLLSLVALAIILLGCAAPAHADSISVDLDATAVTLQRSGNLYKHNSSVSVHNSNDYGFTLNLNTDQPDLVNSEDSTYRINSVTGYYKYLAANQWGYGAGSDATSFNPVSNATLADVTKNNNGDCYSISDCTIKLTFGANIDSKRLPVGSYSTSLTYTATSKPAPYVPPTPAPDPEPSTPSGGGGSSSHSNLYDLCESMYPGSTDIKKWQYCFNHNGDMSGYEPDWEKICSDRYPGSDVDSLNRKSYCIDYKGDMSGYREPEQNWGAICRDRYPGNGEEEGDKWAYCYDHKGDMSGYRPNWSSICYDRYSGDTDKQMYCVQHQGDVSGYRSDWRSVCRSAYYYDDRKRYYCETHYGDMSGYDPYNP